MIIKYDFLDYQIKNFLEKEIIVLSNNLFILKNDNEWYNNLESIDNLEIKIKNKKNLFDNEIDSNLSAADKIALLTENYAQELCENLLKYGSVSKEINEQEVEYTFWDKSSLVFDIPSTVTSICNNCLHCSTTQDGFHMCKCKINKEKI